MTRESRTDRSLGVDCSSAPATCVAKNRSVTAHISRPGKRTDCPQTEVVLGHGYSPTSTYDTPLFSVIRIMGPTTTIRRHPESGTCSVSDAPTRPCYPATDVCDTIGHAIAGCARACRAWRRSLAGTKGMAAT